MITRVLLIPAFIASGWFVAAPTVNDTTANEPRVIEVRMIDISATEYKFEPATIEAQHGDIVKFVQTTAMPHNVEWRDVADDALPVPRIGPYLTQPEQVYEVPITEAFAPGEHKFVCTPHEFMGMVGKLVVSATR